MGQALSTVEQNNHQEEENNKEYNLQVQKGISEYELQVKSENKEYHHQPPCLEHKLSLHSFSFDGTILAGYDDTPDIKLYHWNSAQKKYTLKV